MFQIPDFILLIILFLFSFNFTFLYRRWAIKRSIMDFPSERSSHTEPTPRGGGIAIVIVFYSGISFLYLNNHLERNIFYALLPGLILAAVGLIDDVKDLAPSLKLAVQFLCAGIALFFLHGFHGLFGSDLKCLWSIIALFGIVWFINLFNFLDGSDGYASMEAIFVALSLWFFTGMNLFLIIVFTVGGFLYWNWPKAKIFLGDSGSTTLGFIFVVLGISLHNSGTFSFLFWILITALFWFDATITLIRRMIKKEILNTPHKNHMYQRAISGGFSHLKVLIFGLGINILLFLICLITWRNNLPIFYGFLLAITILGFALIYVDRKFAQKSR
jgi:UDP-N-acetylmuramyl pentapeptide phosphotransferase/UDP-N-acetylglucosamine-1-phosphate transferase